ncbi:RNA 2',3'-cyclic phosphodiesterase [Geobacter sp. DSM 9736]|uniref:RNA 2',3'-cyclic phosphodiesterase n=1 Tax=Geobacter sp. DSM 9736 TaxID=1277350 RepID=UPI000B50FCA1|nr:RNA 2',3'-cyclic phosphodiesterase [Geobacter sp. DSM 9736]SNB47373.1 2'-5' RNA ligase [Geobacter sp. DSM 9736]
MHRLFVAVDLPDQVRRMIGGLAADLPGARLVPADQIHLTLRFIGEVDGATFSRVRNVLEKVPGCAFTLSLRGLGHFPPGRHPRVLWVGIDECVHLTMLQKSVESALSLTDLPPEDRKFSPHITLARLKETPPGAVERLESRHRELSLPPFPVKEFHLYSSILSEKGAVHRREATYPLSVPD